MTTLNSPIQRLIAATIYLLLASHVKAGGYHYNRPGSSAGNTNSGHYFAPIPTISPLPAIPTLPPLPTAPPKNTQTRTLFQVHPPSRTSSGQAQQQPGAYRPGAYNYRPPSYPSGNGGSVGRPPVTQLFLSNNAALNPPPIDFRPSQPIGGGAPQNFNYGFVPDNEIYVVNGRQLKQYAVVEVVDNDISQESQPFLTQSFFNNLRAQVGASGTGAIAPLPAAMQLDSTANAILLEQQRLAQQQGAIRRGDSIALGSGGIGFIRLPDGTISLGSGSLNFVTAQQHLEEQRNARTRSELLRDPLHFGHGPLQVPNNQVLRK